MKLKYLLISAFIIVGGIINAQEIKPKKVNETEKHLNFVMSGSIGTFISNRGDETCISLTINDSFSADYFQNIFSFLFIFLRE